jgi:hypothetical protein
LPIDAKSEASLVSGEKKGAKSGKNRAAEMKRKVYSSHVPSQICENNHLDLFVAIYVFFQLKELYDIKVHFQA